VPEKHRSNVQHALQSKSQTSDSSWRNSSLVGHTENARKALDGLQLKVSKKFWAKVSDGSEDWHLLKIGSNVTALREFTALCRMDVLPLKRYLLGQHLDTAEAKRTNEKHNESATKAELLNKMGGVDALGRGFTDYVHKKFNPSQLQAISASATDYGDGGFTLIKGEDHMTFSNLGRNYLILTTCLATLPYKMFATGPPGTGKQCVTKVRVN
jgi:senataxin